MLAIHLTLANPKIESIGVRHYNTAVKNVARGSFSFSHCTARGRNNTLLNEPPQQLAIAFVTRSPPNKNVSYSVLLFLKKDVNR